jgi:signal transduction histidine kinase
MTVSYVLVTAAAVVLVEGVVLAFLLPRVVASAGRAGRAATVAEQAGADAKALTVTAVSLAAQTPRATTAGGLLKLLARSPQLAGLRPRRAPGGKPAGRAGQCLSSTTVWALISPDGVVLASSKPAACAGARLGFAARPGLSGRGTASGGQIVWAVSPVYAPPGVAGANPVPGPPRGKLVHGQPSPKNPASGRSPRGKHAIAKHTPVSVLGGVYVQAPAAGRGVSLAQVKPLLITGALALGLVLPVGTVFGLLSTRRVIRRIKRLAAVTATVADGDFEPRVPVSGGDEISRLEDGFNRMTGRLSAAVAAERARAGSDARQAERARIARELHDSISQDLFSLSLLAAGLRKALRGDRALAPEVAAMERTAARAMREMQALLLELRPVALEDAGLVPAVTELCQAYQARLAIKITAELDEVCMDAAAEHAVLRIITEALGNAARHGRPEAIVVRLGQQDGAVMVEVRDNGRGFDPGAVAERHGMGLSLMRERVTELGGEFLLDAAPGQGAAIVVQLPVAQDGRP